MENFIVLEPGNKLNADVNLQEIKDMIAADSDFIYSPRFNFSMKNLMDKFPEGASDKLIAQVLLISEEEVRRLAEEAMLKLREKIITEHES